jgi:ribosome-binding ATPase
MQLGIVGLPNSGKTTLFNALTGGNYTTGAVSSGQFEVHTAVVSVPDQRVDTLAEMVAARKRVFPTVTYRDIGGLDKGIGEGGLVGQLRNELASVDGFLHVVRAFRNDVVPHPYVTIDPLRDIAILDGEFLLMDLVTVETRLERLANELRIKGRKADTARVDELPLLQRLKAHLETERPLRDMESLTDEEISAIKGFGFLSLKPVLIVLNQGDTVDGDPSIAYPHRHAAVAAIQAGLEAEMAQLDAEDARMFMAEYGLEELSADRVVRLSYELMRIHSFLTAGEKEARAWSIPIGATAWEAAGAIHSDIQHGFIRAEVIAYDDYVSAGGEKEAKAMGKMRLESRDYVVEDGDVIVFRHSG